MRQDAWNGSGGRGVRVTDPDATADERTYATFIHLTILLFHFVIPIIPALIMWQIKKAGSPFLDDHGKEAVNFQISLLIYFIVSAVLAAILIGFVLMVGVYVLGIVGMIMAAAAANRGEYFRYPMCIRLIA
jgi:uncharacterized protein